MCWPKRSFSTSSKAKSLTDAMAETSPTVSAEVAAAAPLDPPAPAGPPKDRPLCSACGQFAVTARQLCKQCLATTTMVWRNIGGWPAEFGDAEKKEFLKSATLKRLEDPRLQWKTLKCSLEERLVRSRVRQETESFGGKFLPMGCWLQQGFSEEHIKRSPQEYSESLGDTVYQLRVRETQETEIKRDVSEFIMGREAAAQKKKEKGQKKRDVPEDWEVPEEEAAASAAGPRVAGHHGKKDEDRKRQKEMAKAAAEEARAKAAAEKKAQREQEANQKLTRRLLAIATNKVQPVDAMLKRLGKAFGDAEKYMPADKIAASIHHGVCREAEAKFKLFLEQSQALIRKAAEGAVVQDESALDTEAVNHLRAAGPALRGLQGEIDAARPERPKRAKKGKEEGVEPAAAAPPAEKRPEDVATQPY